MRRRLQKFLPVVMLALMVQVLAPIAAAWAALASDPLQAVPICHSGATGSADGGVPDNNGPGSQHSACDLCYLVQAGGALEAPKGMAVATPYRVAASVVWRHQASEPARSFVGSNTQARAPPLSM